MLRRILSNREALTVLVFAVANGVGGLLANRLVTQVISPEELGEFYLLVNLTLWLTLPASSAYVYVQRHWAVARAHELTGRFMRGLLGGFAIQAVIAAVGAGILRCFRIGTSNWGVAAWLALSCVGQAILQVAGPIQAAERRRVAAGLVDLAQNPLRQAVLAGAATIFGLTTASAVLAVQASYVFVVALVVLGAAAMLSGPSNSSIPSADGLRQISVRALLSYSLPFGLSAAIAQVCASAERWGLARLDNTAATALFVQSAALSLAVTTATTNILGTYYYPIVAQLGAKSKQPLLAAMPTIRRYIILTGILMASLALGAAILAGWVTPILFGPRFAGVAGLLPWTMLGCAFFGMGSAYSIYSYAARETVSLNVARGLSQFAYAGALLTVHPMRNPALLFARLFAAANCLYLLLMVVLTHRFVISRVRSVSHPPNSR